MHEYAKHTSHIHLAHTVNILSIIKHIINIGSYTMSNIGMHVFTHTPSIISTLKTDSSSVLVSTLLFAYVFTSTLIAPPL
jgi:hypothetical protein